MNSSREGERKRRGREGEDREKGGGEGERGGRGREGKERERGRG